MSGNDDDSFSSDSDDEFLTMRDGGGNVDREALIRKKLLENFYGKTPAGDDHQNKATSIASSADSTDDSDLEDEDDPLKAEDLDAPQFNAAAHTAKNVLSSGVHPLLETEEQLACQVRTLDSSLQTLVYENYSRFIDATDAIKNIGVNVQANLQNLESLQTSMQVVSESARSVETEVGQLRDQVVEKLRVKRLLQRLDTLLKLPATLRQQIASGKYRWATQSYLSAYSILSKHSTGFESLQRIETECQEIIEKLLHDVRRKLIHWSGGLLEDDEIEDLPDPPQTIADIFECAGTPSLIIQQEATQFRPGLTMEECQEMALQASLRLLERILDTHHIELQESLLDASETPKLVPTHVLDSILEASTLYSMSFGTPQSNSERLSQFVSMAFNSFLQHVRGELLEQAIQAQTPTFVKTDKPDDDEVIDEQQDTEDQAYEHISNSMTLLLGSAQQLASGLALPEVAIDAELASSLVDQTVGLTEAMVRRRVDQQFYTLRLHVIQDCLAPFGQNALKEPLLAAVQMASVALSDSLQLVDDTVRSILATVEEGSDTSMLKQAVEQSTKRFARWLASAMERLAGCESSDPKFTLECKAALPEEGIDNEVTPKSREPTLRVDADDMSEVSQEQPDAMVENALFDVLEVLEPTSDMVLAIAEMCRVAERSVMENILQSIATHGGGGKKPKATGLFSGSKGDTANPISERFRLAASRVLSLYAMNRGAEAGKVLCLDLPNLSQDDTDAQGPRTAAWRALEIVKATSKDCADLFGGSKRGGPVPDTLEDEFASLTMSRQSASRSGLVFDVERMFAEKVVVYPQHSEFAEFQRNPVVALVLKVGFKALGETVRLVRFSLAGYRQLLVDIEFLKWLIPHYVKDEFLSDGSNARTVLEILLSDAISTAQDRILDPSLLGEDSDEKNQARSAVRLFMSTNADDIVPKFVTSVD